VTKNFGLFISFFFKNAPVECILDPEAALLPQPVHLLRKRGDPPFALCLDQQSDNAGDWKAVEPRYAAGLGLVEEQHVGPDLKSKGNALSPAWSSCLSRRTRVLSEGSTTRSHPDSRASRISAAPGRLPPCSTTSCQTAGGMQIDEKRRSKLIRPTIER